MSAREPLHDSLLGAGAVGALIVCCGLPVLVSAGILTGAGALLRNLALLVAGVGLGAVALGWAIRRSRRGAACPVEPGAATKPGVAKE